MYFAVLYQMCFQYGILWWKSFHVLVQKRKGMSFKFWAFVGPFQVTSWQWKAPTAVCCDFVLSSFSVCLFGWLVLFFVDIFCFSFSMSTFHTQQFRFTKSFFFLRVDSVDLFISSSSLAKKMNSFWKYFAVAEDEVYWRTTKWETKRRHSYSLLYPGVKSMSLKRPKDQRILLETLSHLEALLAWHHFFIAYFCRVVVVDHVYVAVFSTLKQTHCVRMWFCMTD